MGSTSVSNKTESMASMMDAYSKYLPGLISTTASTQPEMAMGNLNATLATQPLFDALNLQQAQQYSLPLAQVGQDVQYSNAMAGGRTNRDQILGPGGEAAFAADALSRAVNPNYHNVQDAASQKSVDMLNNINLGGLSGGENAAIERRLNQDQATSGNLGLSNPWNTVSNAMNFGGAYNQKIGLAGQAIGAANQTAQSAQNNGFNPVNIALGQPNVSTAGNFGTNQFTNSNANTQQGSLGANTQMGGNMMNGVFNRGLANNTQKTQANPFESAAGMMGGLGSMGCCFIMMEAYHGMMPLHVRRCRDKYYSNFPDIATGYKKMAKWLVPLMQRSSVVRSFVWHAMVKPLSEYGHFVLRHKPANKKYKWARKVWFTVWNFLGKA